MRRLIKGHAAFVSVAVLFGIATYEAKAVSVTIDSVTGIWTSASPPATAVGLFTDTISWGVPTTLGGPQSSYNFTGVAPPPTPPFGVGVDFILGTFAHNNFPIFAPAITGATLQLTIAGTATGVGSTPFNVISNFQFSHNETPNSSPCGFPSVSICDDIVTAITNSGGSTVVNVDGTNYIFAFTGFQVGGVDFTEFHTQEGLSNTADLLGQLIEAPPGAGSEVPLPGALPLFASGAAMLGLLGWRRKRKPNAAA